MQKNSPYVHLTLVLALSSFLAYTLFGYELGLKKPKFHEGECAQYSIGGEFKTRTINMVIMGVGKREYLYRYILDNGAISFDAYEHKFEYIDEKFSPVSCREVIAKSIPINWMKNNEFR